MTRRTLFLLALAAATLCTGITSADIVVGTVARSVMTAAGAPLPGPGMMDSNSTPGAWSGIAFTDVIGPGGAVSTDALQASTTPAPTGPTIFGSGDAFTSGFGATPPPPPAGYSLLADSKFDVIFTVDAASLYDFDASVTWLGTAPPVGGGAMVELRDVTVPMSTVVLHSISKSVVSPGVMPLDTTITLSPGVTYQLVAEAKLDGGGAPGPFTGEAHFMFELTAIPEAGSLLLMSPIVLGAAFGAWRSAKRRNL